MIDLENIDQLLFNEVLNVGDFLPITVLSYPEGEVLLRGEAYDTKDLLSGTVGGGSLGDVGRRRQTLLHEGSLVHFSEVSIKEARVLGLSWRPGMHFFTIAKIGGGTVKKAQCYVRKAKRGEWFRLATKHQWSPAKPLDDLYDATLFIALQRRYSWQVALQVDEGPRIEFLTTSQEAREVFRLRDKPLEGGRRPALRHWVSRLGKSSSRDPWYLRGACEFSWEGVKCKLTPSDFDRQKEIARLSVATR